MAFVVALVAVALRITLVKIAVHCAWARIASAVTRMILDWRWALA